MNLSSLLARRVYNALFPFVFLLLLPANLRRMVQRGNYRENFWQRFGFYSAEIRARLASGPPRPWLQAVSVGEMLTALKLVDALRARQPGMPLILSTTTTTGYQLARERAGEGVEVIYTPVDLAWAVRRAFDVLRPAQVVIVDGGLWPTLLWEARRRGMPTALVNARLSPRSEQRFRRWRRLAAAMLFHQLDLVCVSEPDDVSRWERLGVPPTRLRHTGSVKFDGETTPDQRLNALAGPREFLDALGFGPDAPVLLAGSTHPGEEEALGQIFQNLRPQFPDLRLLVAPRHVERTRTVRAELEALGLKVALRTEPPGRAASPPEVLLLNTTGELRDWYAVATVVFIGKSLLATGGQNPAEALAAGRAVVFGPHMENFRDLVERLLPANGAVQASDTTGLQAACARLLADPAERARVAENGQRQLAAHHGAAGRTADELLAQRKISTCQAG